MRSGMSRRRLAMLAERSYGAGLLAAEAVRAALPHWLPSIVFGTYRYYAYLPALLLAALVFRDRDPRRHALSLLAAAVFLGGYGGQFVPLRARGDGPGLKVVTLNIEAGSHGAEAVRRYLRQADADLVALQEVDAGSAVLNDLRARGYEVRHRPYGTAGRQGIALACRPPCRLVRDITVAGPPHSRWTYLMCEVELADVGDGEPARRFNAIVSHLASFGIRGAPHENLARNLRSVRRATPWQMADTDAIMDRVARFRDPTLLLGDFNSTPEQDLHRRIRDTMTDAWRAAGFGYGGTRTYGLPLRIDYIYASRDFRVLEAHRGPAGLSDHRPVAARVDLN